MQQTCRERADARRGSLLCPEGHNWLTSDTVSLWQFDYRDCFYGVVQLHFLLLLTVHLY